jgi:hypothetical protein
MAQAEIVQQADRLVARAGDRVLFEYVFEPALARELAPRPYFHPVRTLGGVLLTDHQPADHRWHLGIAYSWPVVNRLNFWGGPTFVRGQGYQQLDNHGRINQRGWTGGEEQLEWLDRGGVRIALERRRMTVPEVATGAGSWTIELDTEIENSGPGILRFGSPTTEGRPMAGYAGLAWRGPAALRDAAVLLENGAEGEPMGRRSRWLALAGGGATVAIAEHPRNPGVPNRWFVRTEEYPLVTSSPVFDRYLELEPGRMLRLRHRLLVSDGVWSRERLAHELRHWLDPVA